MWRSIFKVFFVITFKLFFRLKAQGQENIPKKNNFIVVANHASFLDPILLELAISQKIHWIVLNDVLNTKLFWAKWFMHKMGAVPCSSATQKSISLLKNNANVGIFPEGTRTYDGKLRDFRRGAALLAIKTGRPILPCAIIGAYEAYPRKAKFIRPHPIKIKIGKPIYLLKDLTDVIDDIAMQEGMFKARNVIKELLNNG